MHDQAQVRPREAKCSQNGGTRRSSAANSKADGITCRFLKFAAATLSAVLAAAAIVLDAQAAAPGTAQYIQTVNRAIMYTEGVYEDSEGLPMTLADAIACSFADARPATMAKSYADRNGYQRRSETTTYTWNGTNIASRTDQTQGSNFKEQWNYSWDANGYLNKLTIVPQGRYYSTYNSKGATLSIQLGADGRPSAMSAPMVYPWYSNHQQRVYAFAYDAAGRITAMSKNVSDSETGQTTTTVINYIYNPDGTLKLAADVSDDRYQSFHYDAAGRLAMSFLETTGSYGSGDTAIAYAYDAANRPGTAVAYSGGQLDYQKAYSYNY